ncbi:hypothetical protein [Arthrobacter rhombi]|uniref:hypothetical protein n=1 Tax=Arthrobacter rhombi TaxID=71253 RepID=UPI003FD237D9
MSASFRTADNRTTGDRLEVGNHGEHVVLVIAGRREPTNIMLTPRDAEAMALEILDPGGQAKRERAETMLERNRRTLDEELARGRAEAEQRKAREAEAESIRDEARKLHELRKRRAAVAAVVAELEADERREPRKARK